MPLCHLAHHFAPDDPLGVAVHQLGRYPDVSPAALCCHARVIGQAGEALVDSLLLRHGLVTAALPDGQSADRLLLMPRRSLKLQIKTRTRPASRGYAVRMRKGFRNSGGGCRDYAAGEYDVAVLVALPINTIMFTAARSATLVMPHDAIPRLSADPLASLDDAVAELCARDAPVPVP